MKYFVTLLLFISLHSFLFAGIIMTPYLQAVTPTSVYVLIECDNADTVSVHFGLTKEFGMTARTGIIAMTKARPSTFVHKVLLQGLTPSTRYHYFASQGESVTREAAFSTAYGKGEAFRMVWMADCRTGTDVFSRISRNMLKEDPVVALYGGDLCHNSRYKSWKKEFFNRDQLEFASQVPFFNATGNHEGWEQNTKAFTMGPESESQTQDFYSFDYGDVHVLCLNTALPYGKGSPQYQFAEKDLARTSQPWKIVTAHVPAYCRGGHGEDAGMVAMTRELFEPARVDMVLTGHSHFFQHNLVNGIHHMVIGSAGAPLYSPKMADYTVAQARDYNFAVIDVSATKISVIVYNDRMNKLDEFELIK